MSVPARYLVIGTAGHIDHGKTSLVRALTGVDTDRLAEEKRRGITIELGFAPWRLGDGVEASIVDVPGHERLVRTMVAGAGGIDLALLVVAADDGVMPQTREHLDVLTLLAVPRGVVVLNKCDLVDAELAALVEEDVRAAARATPFAQAPAVRVSSKTGEGLDALRAEVARQSVQVAARPVAGPAFLPLDRVFVMSGHGTVATGTLLRGTLRVGDALEAWGEKGEPVRDLKIRGLQALGRERDAIPAGMRAAVNLSGRDVERVARGMVLAPPGAFLAVGACIAWLDVLARAKPLGDETVTVHLGTSERPARVIPLGGDEIAAGAAGGVLLRFTRPVAAFAGQRLVLRRPGIHGQATVAGGVILDPEPPRGKGAVSLAASQLGRLRGDALERLTAIARESRARGVDTAQIERRLGPGEGPAAVRSLLAKGALLQVSAQEQRYVDAELVAALAAQVVTLVKAHLTSTPLAAGLGLAEVESQLKPPDRPLAALAIERALAQGQLVREGALLAIPGRGSAVDAKTRAQMDALVAVYQEAQLTPPADDEAGSAAGLERKRTQELLAALRRQRAVVKVADGLHFAAEPLAALEARLIAALAGERELTASAFKELAGGVSRKFAIPLLEYFDRVRATLRVGDVRKLHPSRRQS